MNKRDWHTSALRATMMGLGDASSLGWAFAKAAGRGEVAPPEAEALHREIEQAHARAQARWGFALEPASFAAFLGARVASDEPLGRALAQLQTVDLYLAAGCSAGRSDAIAAFQTEYVPSVPGMIARLVPPTEIVRELRENLLPRLMVATETRGPRIATYGGRGSLAGWLKVVVLRATVAAMERREPESDETELSELSAPGRDPDFDLLQEHYGDAFREAFRAALSSLSDRDRRLLRASVVRRLTVDQIGEIEGVHRSTAARWLVRIREGLHRATTAHLEAELQLSPGESESLIRALSSQLTLTVAPYLETGPVP